MENLARDIIHEVPMVTDHPTIQVLIVDDEEPIQYILSRVLGTNEYACTLASNAAEARSCLKNRSFELVLCDVNMPGESGMDFIRYTLAEYPDTAVVMVTAIDDPDIAETALEIGAYGYVIKPFDINEIRIKVANALRRRKSEMRNRRNRENLQKQVSEHTAKLQKTLNDLHKTVMGSVQALGLAVEARDPYTARHQTRVAELACAIAAEMGLSEDQIEGIRIAGLVHDIGKISLPSEICFKLTVITEREFGLIKCHPQVGYDILKEIDFPWPISQIVYQHHERLNGSGYPQGLSGEDILPEARIVAVADVVEAIACDRPYRPAVGIDQALDEIAENKGTLYDGRVVDACLKLFTDNGFKFGGNAFSGSRL